jgi:hypothetical protein
MSIFGDIGQIAGAVLGMGAGGSGGNRPDIQLQTPVTAAQATEQYGNVQAGLSQQQQLINAMNQAGGQNVYGGQMGLIGQLQQQAAGQGPNPAQTMLAQNSANAAQQQAALMAGQRGTGGNAGLMARQIGNQGAMQQQQMAGQAATLGAQQQLAAQQQLGQQQAQMAGQLSQGVGQFGQQAQGAYGQTLGGINAQNQAQIGKGGVDYQTYAADQKKQAGALGGLGAALQGGLGNAIGDLGGAALSGLGSMFGPAAAAAGSSGGAGLLMALSQGGEVPNHDGPRSKAGMHFRNMKSGGNVAGTAKVAGDSQKNDNQPAMLSPGEIVIPRSITTGKNAPAKAAEFVRACLAKGGRK